MVTIVSVKILMYRGAPYLVRRAMDESAGITLGSSGLRRAIRAAAPLSDRAGGRRPLAKIRPE